MTVAYQGAPGAFSHDACLRLLPDEQPVARDTFELVVAAVEAGETDYGVLPLSNNRAGETGARALIAGARVRVVEERELPIRVHLLGLPGASLDGIRTVVSHPIAIRQCAKTLASLGLEAVEAPNTAVAAASLGDTSRAVLASESAAGIYGLAVLKRDVHDRPDNATIFAVLARGTA